MLPDSKRVVLSTGLNKLTRRYAFLSPLDKTPCIVLLRVVKDIGAPHLTRVNRDVRSFPNDGTIRESCVPNHEPFEAN